MPLKKGDSDLAARYEQFFQLPSLKIIELTEAAVERATHLRAPTNLHIFRGYRGEPVCSL